MRVPGDIVPRFFSGTGRTGRALGGSLGRERGSASSGQRRRPARPESQPRAGAQRGAHGLTQTWHGETPRSGGPFGPARTRARPGTRARGRGGVPPGRRRPPPRGPGAALAAQRRGQAWVSRAEAASSGSRYGAGGSPHLAASIPQRAAATQRRGGSPSLLVRSMARLGLPGFSAYLCCAGSRCLCGPAAGQAGRETLRGRYSSPANGWTAPAAARARKRVRPAGLSPQTSARRWGHPRGAAQPRSLASAPTVKGSSGCAASRSVLTRRAHRQAQRLGVNGPSYSPSIWSGGPWLPTRG